jgi:DNA replication and repair protein RecF
VRLSTLKLYNFKNHTEKSLDTAHKIIGIWGDNGVGKSNILDAISFLTVGKSYFSSTDTQCIYHESNLSGLKGVFFEKQDIDIKIKLQKGKRKVISKNDKPYSKIAEHVGNFLSVMIAPGDIQIIYGSNDVRRSFVDQIICQYDLDYIESLMKYNKLISHRNAEIKSEYPNVGVIQSLDIQLAPLANAVYTKRVKFFEDFTPILASEYRKISDESDELQLFYESQLASKSYEQLTKENTAKDFLLKRSTVGIHKDEIEMQLDGVSLKTFGSQGQIKSSLIALKIAGFEILKANCKKTPILLLDDIFEKIDENRAHQLTQIIKNGHFDQIFITDTHKERLEYFCSAITTDYKLIHLTE